MKPDKVRDLRLELGVSQETLGKMLRLGKGAANTVARWERPEDHPNRANIPGPAQVALELLVVMSREIKSRKQ